MAQGAGLVALEYPALETLFAKDLVAVVALHWVHHHSDANVTLELGRHIACLVNGVLHALSDRTHCRRQLH